LQIGEEGKGHCFVHDDCSWSEKNSIRAASLRLVAPKAESLDHGPWFGHSWLSNPQP
jgi:hypothetical protein